MRDTREPADIARQLSLKTWVEPALRRAATIEINSRMPLDEVVERIVRLVSCAVATQQPWVCTQPMRTSAPRRPRRPRQRGRNAMVSLRHGSCPRVPTPPACTLAETMV